jgi:hypothetical protein
MDGIVTQAPVSLGSLPVGIGPGGELLLPIADEEAFWIGLSVEDFTARIALAVEVVLADGNELDAITGASWSKDRAGTVMIPETRWIDGIHRSDGRVDVFARVHAAKDDSLCRGIRFWAMLRNGKDDGMGTGPPRGSERGASVFLSLVDYETFRARTGLAPPAALDSDAGYKGWRLP